MYTLFLSLIYLKEEVPSPKRQFSSLQRTISPTLLITILTKRLRKKCIPATSFPLKKIFVLPNITWVQTSMDR